MSKYSKDSKNYWIERTAEETWKVYNDLEKQNKALINFYAKAIEDINKEVSYLLSRIESGEITRSELYNYRRLMQLNQNLNNRMVDLALNLDNHVKGRIEEGIKKNYKKLNEALEVDFSMNNDKLIEMLFANNWSGEMFSEKIWESTETLAAQLNSIVKTHLIKGSSIKVITDIIKNKMDSHYKNTLRVVRTETMHYLNASSLQSYKDAGIEEVEMLAAKDERTCEICGGEHGKKYPINEVPILPLHPHCRCTTIPVVHIPKPGEKPQPKPQPKGWHDKEFKGKEFKTKNDIKKHLLKEYGIKFSDSRKYPIDQEILADAVNWLDKFSSYFEGFNAIRPVELPTLKVKANISAVGHYRYFTVTPEAEEIALNASMFIKKEKMIEYKKRAIAQGWNSQTDGAIGTFVHEYGHYISHNLYYLEKNSGAIGAISKKEYEKIFINDVLKEYNQVTGEECSFKDVKDLVSQYGASSNTEAFAEAFAEYFGSENPREFSRIFGQHIEKKLNSYIKGSV